LDENRPFPRGAKAFKAADGRDYDEAELQRGSYLKIDHILVWNDPRDWSVDSQIITDLLLSHQGYLGTVSRKNGDTSLPNNGYQQDGQPPIWVSNLDLHWRTEYHINRFGTGAFVEALKGVWSAASDGSVLQFNFMGKPSKLTYDYTHDRLLRYKQETLEPNVSSKETAGPGADPNEDELPDLPQLKRVYMVGDNPESDVRGALEYFPEDGTEWVPILVRTGVWKQTDVQREPKYKPAVIVDDVLDAINWGMRREGIDVDREGLKKALGGA
jgi:HAD superfamily hydrolase (TIGR01456 family)